MVVPAAGDLVHGHGFGAAVAFDLRARGAGVLISGTG